MAGLDPAIKPASVCEPKKLDGRLKGGHDKEMLLRHHLITLHTDSRRKEAERPACARRLYP